MWNEIAVARNRQRREHERDVFLAYATEFMARQKELGKASIEKLLPKQRQTPAQQFAVMQNLSAQLGVPLRTVPRKRPR